MAQQTQQPRLTWARLIIGLVVLGVTGLIVWQNIPRPVRADLGLVSSVDKFDYTHWDSQITLSKDESGRAALDITETIVAGFPDRNQNRGIVRGIPTPVTARVTDLEVTNADGDKVPFEREYDADDGAVYILTGSNHYVHGEQTYVISYRVEGGVVRDPQHQIQELYWNLLPLNSTQAIGDFSATVRIAPELTEALTGDHSCYQGRYGGTSRCELQVSTDDGAQVYAIQSGHRAAGDGVTVAIGFADGTFKTVPTQEATTPPTMFDRLYATGAVAAAVAGLAMVVVLLARWRHRRFTVKVIEADPRPRNLPPMPQSGVPTTLPPPVATALVRADRTQRGKSPRDGKAIAGRAEMIHLAVQGVIRFEQQSSPKHRITVRLLAWERARHRLDQQMVEILFPDGAAVGTVREIPRKDTKFAKAVQKMTKRGRKAAARQGLLRLHSHPIAVVLTVLAAALAAAALVMVADADGEGRAVPFFVSCAAIVAVLLIGRDVIWPEPTLTEKGWAARDQLRSVNSYLRRTLRRDKRAGATPGAEAVTEEGLETLQIYERLLPYAMVFGLASKWSRLLATRYEASGGSMLWMTGRHAAFLGHWQYLNSTVRKAGTYTPPSTSSGGGGFSGGSVGGGFSGGGGGGGFSGGR